jgi:cysteine synthase
MALRLCEEEGLFAGTTSGGNVVAAIRLGQRLGPKATVATLLVDSGLRYLGMYRKVLAPRISRQPT